MRQQLKVKTADGYVKRLGDWNPEKQELHIVFGSEIFTFHLVEENQFSHTQTEQKPQRK